MTLKCTCGGDLIFLIRPSSTTDIEQTDDYYECDRCGLTKEYE